LKRLCEGDACHISSSPPARGRGLKPYEAPAKNERSRSPPARGRGLKHRQGIGHGERQVSPPARGRGLKLGWMEGVA